MCIFCFGNGHKRRYFFFLLISQKLEKLVIIEGMGSQEKNVKPRTLRIEGHKMYTVCRDYLAIRKVNTSTQTCYRAVPRLTIFR